VNRSGSSKTPFQEAEPISSELTMVEQALVEHLCQCLNIMVPILTCLCVEFQHAQLFESFFGSGKVQNAEELCALLARVHGEAMKALLLASLMIA